MLTGVRQALPENLTQLTFAQAWAHFGRRHTGTTEEDPEATVDSVLATLVLRHHFGEGWSADLGLPAGSVRVHADDPTGAEETRRVTGLADLELGAAYDFAALWGSRGYRPSARFRAGLGLPTGKDGKAEMDEMAPPGTDASILALGLASWSAIGELTVTQFLHRRVALLVPLSFRVPLSSTEHGLDFGSVFHFGLSGLVLLHDRLAVSIGAEHQIRGQTREQEEGLLLNSGSQVTRVLLNLSASASERLTFFAGFGTPLRVDVKGTQISESFMVQGGITIAFGAGAHADQAGDDDDAHDHGAADSHDHPHDDE